MSEVLAVIPARGGSKGVPRKNAARVGGIPLVVRSISACLAAARVTRIAVSTDDEEIGQLARDAGAEVVWRPSGISGDTASSEAALLHAMTELYGPAIGGLDVVAMIQCTSPFTMPRDIDDTVSAVVDQGADTAFTAAPFHGFLWQAGNSAVGVNHDQTKDRARRQDIAMEFLETGAVYAMKARPFLDVQRRFFGTIRAVPSDPQRVLEIDDPADLERARFAAWLLDRPLRPGLKDLDAVVLDFDGTQTDDRVWMDTAGNELVAAHRGDGLGIAALRDSGVRLLALSTEKTPLVAARAAKLRIECIHGIDDKAARLVAWCEENELDLARVMYVGNDVNDLGCLRAVGWPVAVASAYPVVKAAARLVTRTDGGSGAIREIATWLLGEGLRHD